MNSQEKKMKKGFTLVEILVVLVIIGILVALILPNALKSIDNANVRSAAATLRNIDTAIKSCYSDKQSWAVCGGTSGVADLEPGGTSTAGYMDQLPNSGKDPWGIKYAVIANPDGAAYGYVSDKSNQFTAWPDLSTAKRGAA